MTVQTTTSDGSAALAGVGEPLPLAARADPVFVLEDGPAQDLQVDLLVVPVFRGVDGPVIPDVDLVEPYVSARLRGEVAEDLLVARRPGDGFGSEAVLLVGMGPHERVDADLLRRTARRVGHRYQRFTDVGTTLPQAVEDPELGLRATVEGLCAGGYRFRPYGEGGRSEPAIARVYLLVGRQQPDLARHVERAATTERAVAWARDLVNIPAGFLDPALLAEHARQMAQDTGLSVRVWDDEALREGGFGGILGVGSGSGHESRLVELRYTPPSGRADRLVALTGKGVTFDSGGLALKKCTDMLEMKSDMAGAASVLGTMRVIAEVCPPDLAVVAAIPCAENMPGSSAVRPGDVLRHRNGLTTEVVDPDCEGRLVLADALAYLAERKPGAVLDVATLTYSCISALGTEVTAAVGNDKALMAAVCRAGAAVGEPVWELPLWQPYRRQLGLPRRGPAQRRPRRRRRRDRARAVLGAVRGQDAVGAPRHRRHRLPRGGGRRPGGWRHRGADPHAVPAAAGPAPDHGEGRALRTPRHHLTRRLAASVVLTVLAVLCAACTGSAPSGGVQDQGGAAVKEGGVLRIATSSGIDSLNPFVGINQDDYSVWNYIYPHLVEYDTTTPTYDYVGSFATSWTQSPDGRTITFHTQRNAHWSDGQPLNAEDVAGRSRC